MSLPLLRNAWTKVIQPGDYEAHMAAVGQAQANAALVAEYLAARQPRPDASLLFVGAGTGQMFEFVSPRILVPFETTFADINPDYLRRLSDRLREMDGLRHSTLVDDVEDTHIAQHFDLVVAVLVLEHVDWRKGIATICRLSKGSALVIFQRNPPELATAMTPARPVPASMQVFAEIHPALIDETNLIAAFADHGFALDYSAEKIVRDDKKMIARGFKK